MDDAPGAPPAGPLTGLALAVGVTALGVATVIGSLALGAGTPARPDSGTWPLLVGLALCALGAVLAVRFRRPDGAEAFTRASWPVAAGLATTAGFVSVIGTIGFEVPSFALMVFWLRVLGRESWRSTLLVAPAAVAALYLVFVAALAVPIPHLL
ncbi:tripartite tricarboxylate transporter TctB family protein [Kineosporia sp. J2-2]|uniref:Tripartite tricarboxylate transporter TctB family protein n=1 Tax=Kineosporia corallincola TaxID=2835133 RepID=A0ABS5TKQ2_9ACTN|nr:tripartite tricarboxylate transporter TctB family protein [Kineosporia corallincola]MBT0771680.1 tripartite tricarboxylate transporter TctB family protein [Kineosporia corallincola]